MAATTTTRPSSVAGIPVSAWAFAIRIWLAVLVSLAASFWLDLEAPSTAAITVAILAAPTRGQALEKACYRLLATVIGVSAAIVIVGLFSPATDLILTAFAAWLGLCVYAAGLLDGNRAYAAVLSGYTVGIVAIQELDTPQHVFESGVTRGATIAVGILALAVVNDLLAAPDNYPRLVSQLAALQRRVRDYAKAIIRDEATDPATAAALLRDITALRPEIASLATESASGSTRSAAARSTAVALVVELHAARALDALPVMADSAFRDMMASALDGRGSEPSQILSTSGRYDIEAGALGSCPALIWGSAELLRRDDEVHEGLAALTSGTRPLRTWRMPLYRSHRTAAAAGIRSATWLALASVFFVVAGWPATDVSLSLVAVVIGLDAITPNPGTLTTMALITAPITAVLAGILEFLILDGTNEFTLLAIALAPLVFAATVLMTRAHQVSSALGRLNLIFILLVLSPSNPPSYDPETFLLMSLFLCVATGLLLAAQLLIPPVSSKHRQGCLIASARRELERAPTRSDRRLAPEEAMFRDATRIGQIADTAGTRYPAVLEEALWCFDQAAQIRLCNASLARLAGSALSHFALEGRQALWARDTQRIHRVASDLRQAASANDALAKATSGALVLAGIIIDAARHGTPPITENGT